MQQRPWGPAIPKIVAIRPFTDEVGHPRSTWFYGHQDLSTRHCPSPTPCPDTCHAHACTYMHTPGLHLPVLPPRSRGTVRCPPTWAVSSAERHAPLVSLLPASFPSPCVQTILQTKSPGHPSPPASARVHLRKEGPASSSQGREEQDRLNNRISGLRGPPAAGRAQLSLLALFLYLKHSALTWRRREGQPRKPGGLT